MSKQVQVQVKQRPRPQPQPEAPPCTSKIKNTWFKEES